MTRLRAARCGSPPYEIDRTARGCNGDGGMKGFRYSTPQAESDAPFSCHMRQIRTN